MRALRRLLPAFAPLNVWLREGDATACNRGFDGNAGRPIRSRSDRQPAAAPWRRAAPLKSQARPLGCGLASNGIDAVGQQPLLILNIEFRICGSDKEPSRAATSPREGPQLASAFASVRTGSSQAAARRCRVNAGHFEFGILNSEFAPAGRSSPQPPPGGGLQSRTARKQAHPLGCGLALS